MPHRNPDLTQLLDALDPEAPLPERHLWLIALLRWVRGDEGDTAGAVARVRLLLDAAQARPEWRARWRLWWQQFLAAVDPAPLLADYGFSPRTAFVSALGQRLRRKLLPDTPDTTDLLELFDLLFPTGRDAQWLRALDADSIERLNRLLFSDPEPPALPSPQQAGLRHGQRLLLDALMFSVSQVSATGFAAEIRTRMSDEAKQSRPFHALPGCMEHFRQIVEAQGPHSEAAQQAARALREQLDRCRHAAYTVYAHLDEHGISVGIVFRLQQLRERVVRIKALLDCLHSAQPAQATVALLARLTQVGQDSRSIRSLIASSSHLTAAKVAERHAESGEHYITRNKAEYLAMLKAAAGGGTVIAFTTWFKFLLYALALSPFWAGLAAGMNYAASFVLVMLLHWTVATKQPAVTAPAMAAKLKDMSQPGAVDGFVDEVAHLLRSQMAAILGNLGLVVPVVLLICLGLHLGGQTPMLDTAHAHKVLAELNVLGPTALFAAFTGVLLFASSIVAGWVENWFVFHRLDSALAYNPRFTALLGRERARRWGDYLRRHISGFAANISLGLMLGLVPAFAGFFGLGLEVRHVTLSAGQVAAAAWAIGVDAFSTPGFWLAAAALAVIGPLNLGVSFYLAFRLALAAQNVPGVGRARIHRAIWQRLKTQPGSFFRPPPNPSSGP